MTAIVVSVVGAIVLFVGLLTPVSYGWFAYQPLADAAFVPEGSGLFVSRVALFGGLVLGVGLITLAFLAGWRAGANRRS